jgi:type IV secretory pathway TraG/TraD family ATPase VirD4
VTAVTLFAAGQQGDLADLYVKLQLAVTEWHNERRARGAYVYLTIDRMAAPIVSALVSISRQRAIDGLAAGQPVITLGNDSYERLMQAYRRATGQADAAADPPDA